MLSVMMRGWVWANRECELGQSACHLYVLAVYSYVECYGVYVSFGLCARSLCMVVASLGIRG